MAELGRDRHTPPIWDQEDGFWDARQYRAISISWLLHSVCPIDWWWYPEERLAMAAIRLQNSPED